MPPRFVWLDPTDFFACQRKMDSIRKKLPEWRFFRWDESEFADKREAFAVLLRHIHSLPMFDAGKVVYSHGLPSFHADLADKLQNIPENVMFVIISRPDTRTVLYKTASKMEKSALVDVPLQFKDRSAALEWFSRRCEALGIDIDESAGMALVELVGTNASKLIMEAKKLSHMSEGRVFPWAIEKACAGTGEAQISEMIACMIDGRFEQAHAYLNRILVAGEAPIRILAFMASWLRRIYMVHASGNELDKHSTTGALQKYLEKFRKYSKPERTDPGILKDLQQKLARLGPKDKKRKSLLKKIEQEQARLLPSSSPMFPNAWSMHYAKKEYAKAQATRQKHGLHGNWARELLYRIMRAQVEARTGGDVAVTIHDIIYNFSHSNFS